MSRLLTVVPLLVLLGACSSGDSLDESSSPSVTLVAETNGSEDIPVEGAATGSEWVPSPQLISSAFDAGDLSQLDADLYMTMAMFAGARFVPAEYLVLEDEEEGFLAWDHSATSRLVERWGELKREDQATLRGLIPGIDELVGSPVQGFRAGSSSEDCVGVTADVWICIGPSIATNPVPDLPLEEAAAVIRPWVAQAANDSYPLFLALNIGPHPILIKIYLANLHSNSGFTFGLVPNVQPQGAGGICHMYVDVLFAGATADDHVFIGDPAIPDGVPLQEEIKATVAHEMFHCFQKFAGIPFSNWLYEGTAAWSEHHVYPLENTEVRYMKPWVQEPGTAFLSRAYDTSFGFVYADPDGTNSSAVVDVLKANSITSLDSNFSEFWHEVSVSAWNQDPADVLLDNGQPIPGVVADWGIMSVNEDAEETMEFSLPPYSRDVQTFEFIGGTSEDELAEFARLAIDLSSVPSSVKVSALAQTADGWEDPELLPASERVFCRVAVGACNDVAADSIHHYTKIVLIATNTGSSAETFSLPWNTYNPHLHGTWRRTAGPISLIPGNKEPYWILNTSLSFDEPALVMAEDTNTYTLANVDPGWECVFGGSYSLGADPTYGVFSDANVIGTVALTGPGTGGTFTSDCIFTSPNGYQTQVSGLNIPVTALGGPSQVFGFDIQSNDILVVTGFASQYVYERESHTP